MRIVTDEVDLFKSVFKNIGLLADNVDFVFDENEGLGISLLDHSHIVFYSCRFLTTFFTEYEYAGQGTYSLDATELNKILKKCRGDELEIVFDEDCRIRNGSKTFTLGLLDVDTNRTPVPPSIPYTYSIDVPMSFLKESIKDCEMYGHFISFNATDYTFKAYSEGMMGKYFNEYTSDKELEPSESKYNVDKVAIILGADKINDIVTVKGGTDIPLVLEITSPAEDVRVMGLIAPVIGEVE